MIAPAVGQRVDPPRRGRVGLRAAGRLPRPGWLIVIVLIAAAFAVIASRPSAPPVQPPSGDVAKAEQAINDLLAPRSGRDPIADMPADFTAVVGHEPTRMAAPDGTTRAVHAKGGCSSPWGDDNTRWDYGVGCKAHDLGYDLLRYADAKGQPLGPDLRERLDDQLSADMHAMCDINPRGSAGTCRAVASLYTVGLVVNSWHQRWGPPRTEPIGPWSVGLVVIALLLAARMPVLATGRSRRSGVAPPADRASPEARYFSFLRIISLAGIVVAESIMAFAHWGSAQVSWVWPLTWLLQLVPLFFLAGGHTNLLAWRATRSAGGGFGSYLVGRIGWLLRPVIAFVTAWLVVPLSLELLEAPVQATAAFGRIVLQPLWLLGLYLLVVAVAPAMHWLHRRLPLVTPLALAAVATSIGLLGRGPVAAHAGGVVLALLFQQLAFHYVDGRLRQVRRPVLVAVAAVGLLGLIALTTVGGHSKLLIAEPTAYASFAPSLLGVLLIGIVQTCLVTLPRERGVRVVAASAPARAAAVLRGAPMTIYLFYLCALLMLAGVISAARTAGPATSGMEWLSQPRTLLALALIAAPTLLAFMLFERSATADPADDDEGLAEPDQAGAGAGLGDGFGATAGGQLDAIAATVGVGYGALGILGFAATGITGSPTTPALLGIPLDPMANLIHLLLGWYLLHVVHIQASTRSWPWVLTAIACVPPMITTVSGAGTAVHGVTIAGALVLAAWCAQPARRLRARSRRVPETATR